MVVVVDVEVDVVVVVAQGVMFIIAPVLSVS